jgi:hypothetical protein
MCLFKILREYSIYTTYKIVLYGQTFSMKNAEISADDAYIDNKEEVIDSYEKGEYPISIVFKSHRNGLKFLW